MITKLAALAVFAAGCHGEAAPEYPSPLSVSGEPGTNLVEPGILTAGVWDDNLNYDWFGDYDDAIHELGLSGLPGFDEADREAAHARSLWEAGAREYLDIALVLDTTGSMDDELRYLEVELNALAMAVATDHPDAATRWALVLYRDLGEIYVTDITPFTSHLEDFREALHEATASGGGDYAEAPDRALDRAVDLDWREGEHARLLFWLADAPHHPRDAERLVEAVETAADLDVHVYPVAASGSDDLTEYTMRSAAQLTLGRYVFLTDDSGVGYEHKEPDIPCYFVTTLADAILRVVDIEMTGEYREPTEEELIRTGGDPLDGRCQLEDGGTALSF